MVQWIDGYALQPEDLKMVARTFGTAFPATTVWHAHGIADFILMGGAEPRPRLTRDLPQAEGGRRTATRDRIR